MFLCLSHHPSTRQILASALFYCPCRRDPHMFLIHPLSLSSLAAHHSVIHTVASHLQALCFVWSLSCFPWISLQGAELTDLSDWCNGGRLVSYCFPRKRSVASLTSLICPSCVDMDVSDSLYCREKWVICRPKNFRSVRIETGAQFTFHLSDVQSQIVMRCVNLLGWVLAVVQLCPVKLFPRMTFPRVHIKIVMTQCKSSHLKTMNSFLLVWVCTWKLSHRTFLDVNVRSLVYPCTLW